MGNNKNKKNVKKENVEKEVTEEIKESKKIDIILDKLKKSFILYKIWYIVGGIILLAVIIGIIVGLNVKNNKKKELTHEEKLLEYLEEMGKEWYEDYYYDAICEVKKDECKGFLSKYSEIGIKVDLENLSVYPGETMEKYANEFKNDKTDKECDKNGTKVIIYPQDDYRKDDYKVEKILDCGY